MLESGAVVAKPMLRADLSRDVVRWTVVATTLALVLLACLTGCAGLVPREPPIVRVAGFDSLPGEGMELRFAVTLRIQNPNDFEIKLTGAVLNLKLNGRSLANGLTDTATVVPRFGETTLTVPITVSGFDVLRQMTMLLTASRAGPVSYELSGRLVSSNLGSHRFDAEGSIPLQLPSRVP